LARKRPVFVNCPFDEEYRPLFRAMIFTIVRCGFEPRCALEVIDGTATRISKIEKLIEECRLGIHDISRTELDAINHLPRFNMPLELGLFLGAKRYGDAVQRQKKCLVLDVERYRFQRFMSDIAGQDIEPHGGESAELSSRVRAFLNSASRGSPLPGPANIQSDYTDFQEQLADICEELSLRPDELEFKDFTWASAKIMAMRNGVQG
jgi:hypothetical protein